MQRTQITTKPTKTVYYSIASPFSCQSLVSPHQKANIPLAHKSNSQILQENARIQQWLLLLLLLVVIVPIHEICSAFKVKLSEVLSLKKLGIRIVGQPKVIPKLRRTTFFTEAAMTCGRACRREDFDGMSPFLIASGFVLEKETSD